MTLDHAGVTPNPARDRSIKLPREEPEEINPPTADARRCRLPAAAVEAPAAAALARLVGRPRVERRPHPGRRLRRAAPKGPAARRGDQDPARRSGSSCPDARRRARGGGSARARIATRTSGCSPAAAPTRSAPRSAKAAGPPASRPSVAARPTAPADLATAPAGDAVGEDRRVRRPAGPDRDRQHLHPRPARRGARSTTRTCSDEPGRCCTGAAPAPEKPPCAGGFKTNPGSTDPPGHAGDWLEQGRRRI